VNTQDQLSQAPLQLSLPLRHSVQRVLLSALQARRNQGSMWFPVLLLALLFGAPLALWVFLPSQRAPSLAALAFGMLGGMVLILTWTLLTFNVLQQNHPQTARLMPGQLKALRLSLMLVASLVGLTCGLFVAARGGSAAQAALTTLTSIAVCSFLALCIRWPMLWLVLAVLGWTTPQWLTPGAFQALRALWQAQPEALAAAVLAASALALHAVVLGGGAAHEKAHARLKVTSAAFRGQPLANNPRALAQAQGWAWALRGGMAAYSAWLRHLVTIQTQTQTRTQHVGASHARLAMGLGPQVHWTGAMASVLTGVMFSAMVVGVTLVFPHWQLGQSIRGGVVIGTAVGGLTLLFQVPAAMWASRREQALLRLLPQAPQGAALNRWLALRLAGLQLLTTLAQVLVMLLFGSLIDLNSLWASGGEIALTALLLSPLLVVVLWRDWSRLRAPAGLHQILNVAAMLSLTVCAVLWVKVLAAPWWTMAGVTAALLLPLAAWRWRALGRMPAAWPGGRH